jgi:acyl-CoA thioester hydrolase
MRKYHWPVRVYYEDTDAGGVVYYANYLKFMERARSEWLRALGVEQDQLRIDAGVLLMVHSLSVHYLRPARFNQQLLVTVEVDHVGGAKVGFRQGILCDGQLLCQAEVTIACVNEKNGKPMAFPIQLKEAFQGVLVR